MSVSDAQARDWGFETYCSCVFFLEQDMRKRTMLFPNRSDTIQAVQVQKMA